nr:MAG TPA: hypothetical protein [Bacteriophage sp.]
MRSILTALCCTHSHNLNRSQSFIAPHKIPLSFQTTETIGLKYV